MITREEIEYAIEMYKETLATHEKIKEGRAGVYSPQQLANVDKAIAKAKEILATLEKELSDFDELNSQASEK